MTTNPKSGQSHLADEADGELNFQESVLDGRITVTLSASDVKRAMSPSMKREKVIEAGLAQTDGFKAEDGLSQASDKLKSQNPDLDVEKVESQVSGQVSFISLQPDEQFSCFRPCLWKFPSLRMICSSPLVLPPSDLNCPTALLSHRLQID